MTEDEFVSFRNTIATRATAKALLVEVEGKSVWIPQSQIHDDSEVFQVGDTGTLVISAWIARERDLV